MATLKSLVDETTNIKNELKTCHDNLKNNLIEKYVDVLDDDKLSVLIDKVSYITPIPPVIAGGNNTMYFYEGELSTSTTEYELLHTCNCFMFDGNYRIEIKYQKTTSGGGATGVIYVHFEIIREGVTVYKSKSDNTSSTTAKKFTEDVTNIKIKKGDIINVYGYSAISNTKCKFLHLKTTYDFEY